MVRAALVLGLVACGGEARDTSRDSEDPTWRSALYPEGWTPGLRDAQGRSLPDFSYAGYAYGEAPPRVNGPIADVLEFGADPGGEQDSTTAIQAAIDSLDGGGVVRVPEGLYRVDGALFVERSGVVVRGDGPTRTRLAGTRSEGLTDRAMMTVRGALRYGDEHLLTLDGAAHDQQVRVRDPAGLEVGQHVAIGWVITPEFVEEHGMTDTWRVFNDTWRPFFRRTVVEIQPSSGTITLDVPLRYPTKTRDGASLRVERGIIEGVGVEDLALSTAIEWGDAWRFDRSHALLLAGVSDGWVRNVHSFMSPFPSNGRDRHLQSGGVKVVDSKRVTLTGLDLRLAQNRGPGGNGYLVEISRSSEVLTRDSVAEAGRHNFIQNWDFGTSGCVWLRVRSADGRAMTASNSPIGPVGFSEYHHSLAMANLVDSSQIDDGWAAVNRGGYSSGAGHSATESVVWNVHGAGLIRSFQYGHGYVIGTEGVDVQVDLDTPDPFGATHGTAPEDWIEGLDRGADLLPRSLYEDQRIRRLGR